jgi:hypothetical protein
LSAEQRIEHGGKHSIFLLKALALKTLLTKLITHFIGGVYKGGFHKSWAQGVKRKAHPNLGENAISWVIGANT